MPINKKGKTAAAEDPEDVDSDFDNDSDDNDLPNYLPTYCDSDSEHDIPNKYGDINFDLIRPPGGSLTAYYDRLGRVREVPAGFGTVREALVEALKVNGEDMLCNSDIEGDDDDEVDEDELYGTSLSRAHGRRHEHGARA